MLASLLVDLVEFKRVMLKYRNERDPTLFAHRTDAVYLIWAYSWHTGNLQRIHGRIPTTDSFLYSTFIDLVSSGSPFAVFERVPYRRLTGRLMIVW